MIIGILLAAGTSRRYGSNKLLVSIKNDAPMATIAARNLKSAVDYMIVVVRSDADMLTAQLEGEGLHIIQCGTAEKGASIAAPYCNGRRGHPVGFGRQHQAELQSLDGDRGAWSILDRQLTHIQKINCDDPAILIDVDTPADIQLYREKLLQYY